MTDRLVHNEAVVVRFEFLYSGAGEGTSLLGCDGASLGKLCLTFGSLCLHLQGSLSE
jgi:hypothetical protein